MTLESPASATELGLELLAASRLGPHEHAEALAAARLGYALLHRAIEPRSVPGRGCRIEGKHQHTEKKSSDRDQPPTEVLSERKWDGKTHGPDMSKG
jgi:hypothetical protein